MFSKVQKRSDLDLNWITIIVFALNQIYCIDNNAKFHNLNMLIYWLIKASKNPSRILNQYISFDRSYHFECTCNMFQLQSLKVSATVTRCTTSLSPYINKSHSSEECWQYLFSYTQMNPLSFRVFKVTGYIISPDNTDLI